MTKIVLEHITWEDIQEIVEEDAHQFQKTILNPVRSSEEFYTRVLKSIRQNNRKRSNDIGQI